MSEVVRLISAMAERGLVFSYRDSSKIIFQRVDNLEYIELKDWDSVAAFCEAITFPHHPIPAT